MDTNAKIAEIIGKAAEKINKMRATINTRPIVMILRNRSKNRW